MVKKLYVSFQNKILAMKIEISYFDFKNLSQDLQHQLVINKGQMISKTDKNDLSFVLYELGSFSVELIYLLNKNKLAGCNAYQKFSFDSLIA